jgi:hypothetical protein
VQRRASFIAGFFLLTCLVWYATTLPKLATGFAARYYAGTDLANRPTVSTTDDRVSAAAMRRNWPLVDQAVTVRWDGHLLLTRSGTYRFALVSDGSSYLYLDDRIVADNGGPHGPRQVTVDVPLGRGVHSVRVEYTAATSPAGVDLLWATSAFASLRPLAGRAVSPAPLSPREVRLRTIIDVTRIVVVVLWTAGFGLALAALAIVPAVKALNRHHLPGGLPWPVVTLLTMSAVIYGIAIAWGVPGQGWAPDEIIPPDFLDALDRHFSHGWFSKYPPAQFYVNALVSAPLLIWRWLDPTAFAASPGPEIMWMAFRSVTVAMAVGAVWMVYITASYLYGSWPAFVATAIAALPMPAVFYGKVANVDMPYVFWFAISLASFVRIMVRNNRADYVIFALTSTLAVCTKDQAYGLFALPALALLLVRRTYLPSAIATAVVTFVLCHNLLFNLAGFRSHVRYITGGGSTAFRMFEPTLSGQWQLWQAVLTVTRVSMGWPVLMLCLAGLILSLWRPDASSRRLWWAMLPAASYHLTFHAVVGFTYDRFLLPVFLMLALAGGFAVFRLEQLVPSARSFVRAGTAGVLVYMLAYALAIDVALLRDSRYSVEAWMRATVAPGSTVGRIGPVEHVPRIDRFLTVLVIPTADNITATGLDYLVVNADWVERFGRGRPEYEGYRALREGRLGYREVFEARTPIRLAGLSYANRFRPYGTIGYSTLQRLNPPTLVFKRDRGTPAPSARTP